MAKKTPSPYSFGFCFIQDSNFIRVIAQIDELADAGETDSEIIKIAVADGAWSHFSLDWTAVRTCYVDDPPHLVTMGPDGQVLVGSPKGDTEEALDDTDDGPQGRGPVRDLRRIGRHIYAAGMSRQVYRRDGPGNWRHYDAGTVLPLGTKAVAGFNSVDGLSEDDFYAVGFGGEIWRCLKGRWRQIHSPTNLVLHRIKVVRRDLAYASGQEGVLLRGYGETWQEIKHSAIDTDLWDIEWHENQLFIAHDEGLLVLREDAELEPIKFGVRAVTCRHLHSKDGLLVSSGPKHVLWTRDGKRWQEVTP